MAISRIRVYRAAARSFVWLAAAVFGSFMAACGGGEPEPRAPEISTDAPPAASTPPPDGDPADTKEPPPAASAKEPSEPPASSKPTPPPPSIADTASASSGPAPAAKASSMEGKLASRAGSLLVIQVAGASPSPGAKGVLYRHFEQDIGPLHTTGWLAIADVTVKEAKGGSIKLDMVAEKSVIMVNGKKVNHFEPGNLIKLEITP